MKRIIYTILLIFTYASERNYVKGYTFGTRHARESLSSSLSSSSSSSSSKLYEPYKSYSGKTVKESKANVISSSEDQQIKFIKKQKDFFQIWNINYYDNNKINRSPYQVMLIGKSYFDEKYLCGGTLISREWILTAAHCTDGIYEFEVHLGAETFDNYTEPGRLIYNTSDYIVHEQYFPYYAMNDIALIRLPEKIKYSDRIQPVRLPWRRDSFIGEYAIASGWGSNGANMTSEKLEYAELKVLSNKLCKKYFNQLIIRPSTLCAWGINNANVCTGDSGGPLVLKGTRTLIAITSFGNVAGCQKNMPGGFSRITWYLDWIASKTGVKP